VCVNTEGDYHCYCDEGYVLFNHNVCLGKSRNLSVMRCTVAALRVELWLLNLKIVCISRVLVNSNLV